MWCSRIIIVFMQGIGMAPYEELYGRKCRCLLYSNDLNVKVLLRLKFLEEMQNQVRLIQERMKAKRYRHKAYLDLKRML